MPNNLVKSLAKKHGISIPEVEKLWKRAETHASKEYSPSSDAFYPVVVTILKKMLKSEILKADPAFLIESYMDGTKHKVRAEPMHSSSKIFKRDQFLNRRAERKAKRDQKRNRANKKD